MVLVKLVMVKIGMVMIEVHEGVVKLIVVNVRVLMVKVQKVVGT